MRWYRKLCIDLLESNENPGNPQLGESRWKLCDQSSLQMGYLPPNEVDRVVQHAWKGEGRNEEKDGAASDNQDIRFKIYKGSSTIPTLSWIDPLSHTDIYIVKILADVLPPSSTFHIIHPINGKSIISQWLRCKKKKGYSSPKPLKKRKKERKREREWTHICRELSCRVDAICWYCVVFS